MTIEVKIIEDSVSPEGVRLTTFQLRYPRFIHSELMTHRVFSRNASSSRAIPILTMLRNTMAELAKPVEWGSNNPGMQSRAPLTGFRRWLAEKIWVTAGYVACGFAWGLYKAGAHKQIANRVIEPWSHISVVLTSTDFANWFALRNHEDADPTIHQLAAEMGWAYRDSTPKLLQPGEWHLPYTTERERTRFARDVTEEGAPLLARLSAARCARVSYLTHDGQEPSLEKDEKLWAQLVESKPVHASPVEHQATPDKRWSRNRWSKPEEHGNFYGWRQHRKMIAGEAVHEH